MSETPHNPGEPIPNYPPPPPPAPMPADAGWGAQPGYPPAYPQAGGAGYPPPPPPPPPGAPGYPPPGYGQQYDAYGRPLSDKSKVVAGVLGIVLGGLGVGRFYTGHIGLGFAQLLVSLFTCFIGSLWGLIDGILILVNGGTDAQGRVLRD